MMLPRLHAVTDDRVLGLPDFLERAHAVALGPAVALHVRTRRAGRFALTVTERLVALARASDTLVIVNDRIDVALLAGADGVHLPEAGCDARAVQRLGPSLLTGRSAHTIEASRPPNADWVFLGPIWPTRSHPDRPALGPEALAQAGERTVAIGGVTPRRARDAARRGAAGVAVLSALWDAADSGAAARALLLSFER